MPDEGRENAIAHHYVYILLCEDGSYYTGYTTDVLSRFHRHKKGHGARYTRMRRPLRVVYVEECETQRVALKRERQIKQLSHQRKRALVTSRTGKKQLTQMKQPRRRSKESVH